MMVALDFKSGGVYIFYPSSAKLTVGGSAVFGAVANNGASGSYALAGGEYSYAQGPSSISFGKSVVAGGEASAAFGQNSSTYGTNSVALTGGRATGNGSLAVGIARTGSGYANTGGNYSVAIGAGNSAGTTPYVSGTGSVGIFMGDQSGVAVTADNVMSIMGGSLGVGVVTPGAKLDVTDTGTTTSAIIVPRAGNFTGTVANGMIRYNTTSNLFEFRQNGNWVNYTTVSDGRLKVNVEPVADGLGIVNQLNPVFYDWDKNNPRTYSFDKNHEVGFIAQEVERVLPEVVNKGEDGYRTLEYEKIVAVAIAAIKELYRSLVGVHEEISTLKVENEKLKNDLEKQKQESAEIKARLDKIEAMLR